MIISASRRTDIPAYFGNNFYKSLKNGYFKIVNPFNNKIKVIKFNKSDIDGIVFWTKDPHPFFEILKNIKSEGYKFYFQYTLNNYPKNIEPLKYSIDQRIIHLKLLYEIISPYKIFLRYDPIILTEEYNENFHIENFHYIIEKVNNYVDRVIVSFITIYKKIKKKFPTIVEDKYQQKNLLIKLRDILKNFNKKLYICCYDEDLISLHIFPSKCIDASEFGIKPNRHYGQRKLCKCDKSIDIGYYRTCKTGCLYCYAN